MPYTSSPNMSLPIPSVGSQPGPDYADNVNTSLDLIDAHDHTPGRGTPVTPSGLNINATLAFLSNDATQLRSARFTAQSAPIAAAADLGCVYVSGVDLYFNDVSGNQIRLTQGGSIVGASGSITGLVAPASCSYSAITGTFTFQSDVATPAVLDAGSVIIRKVTASGKGITMTAASAIAADYTLTLPAAPPASTKILTMDTSGNIGIVYDVDNSTLEVSSNLLRLKDAGITTAKLGSNLNLPGTNVQLNSKNPVVNGNVAGTSAIRLIWGEQALNGSGTPVLGTGWSCTGHGVTGQYTITFSTPFSATPAITATARQDGYYCTILSRSASNCIIQTFTGASLADSNFTFHAVGPA